MSGVPSGRRSISAAGGSDAMRRIDDDPAGGEGQAVGLRGRGRNVGFHVDGDARGGVAQPSFVGGLGDRVVDPGDVGVNGGAERVDQAPCPVAIGRVAPMRGDDPGCDDPGAGSEVRRQASCDAETDDAAAAAADRVIEGRAQIRDVAVKHGDPGPGGDP